MSPFLNSDWSFTCDEEKTMYICNIIVMLRFLQADGCLLKSALTKDPQTTPPPDFILKLSVCTFKKVRFFMKLKGVVSRCAYVQGYFGEWRTFVIQDWLEGARPQTMRSFNRFNKI